MTLFRHNTQTKCGAMTLYPHMPLFRHQRVSKNIQTKTDVIGNFCTEDPPHTCKTGNIIGRVHPLDRPLKSPWSSHTCCRKCHPRRLHSRQWPAHGLPQDLYGQLQCTEVTSHDFLSQRQYIFFPFFHTEGCDVSRTDPRWNAKSVIVASSDKKNSWKSLSWWIHGIQSLAMVHRQRLQK